MSKERRLETATERVERLKKIIMAIEPVVDEYSKMGRIIDACEDLMGTSLIREERAEIFDFFHETIDMGNV